MFSLVHSTEWRRLTKKQCKNVYMITFNLEGYWTSKRNWVFKNRRIRLKYYSFHYIWKTLSLTHFKNNFIHYKIMPLALKNKYHCLHLLHSHDYYLLFVTRSKNRFYSICRILFHFICFLIPFSLIFLVQVLPFQQEMV